MISEFEVVLRLFVAAVLGCAIGFERERLLRSAGIRTHMLVSIGSCLVMIVSAFGFEDVRQLEHISLDPSRIAAQVVSGIGFLGAGAILLRGHVVKGLTTAASIWVVAGVGLAAGGGLYFVATATTVLILVILAGLKPFEEKYRARVQSALLKITAEAGSLDEAGLKHLLGVRGGQLKRMYVKLAVDATEEIELHLAKVSQRDIHEGVSKLKDAPGVHDVEVVRSKPMDA